MKLHGTRSWVMFAAAIAIAFVAPSARADVVAIGPAAFPGAPQITFTGLANGTEVNLLTVAGVQFVYSFGPGNVVVGFGPGNTNNITTPDIESIGNNSGVLTLFLPSLQNLFGFGFAVLATSAVPNAVIVSLFNDATAVGSLSYNGVPDPIFAGGFAGIQSTLEFNRVQLRFNPGPAAFAVDNIRFANVTTVTPEPATLALVLTGLFGITSFRRRRLQSRND